MSEITIVVSQGVAEKIATYKSETLLGQARHEKNDALYDERGKDKPYAKKRLAPMGPSSPTIASCSRKFLQSLIMNQGNPLGPSGWLSVG